jgi:hypothetical protein
MLRSHSPIFGEDIGAMMGLAGRALALNLCFSTEAGPHLLWRCLAGSERYRPEYLERRHAQVITGVAGRL